jgi:hypothetical protein
MFPISGQLAGAKEATEFNFIVQEPNEIMEVSKDKSLPCNMRKYRIISVSEQIVLKFFCCKKGFVRAKADGTFPSTSMGVAEPLPFNPAAFKAAERV